MSDSDFYRNVFLVFAAALAVYGVSEYTSANQRQAARCREAGGTLISAYGLPPTCVKEMPYAD